VEEVFQRVSPLIELRVGGRAIKTTVEHPFYVEGKSWIKAAALSPGDLLRSHDGRSITLESISPTEGIAEVYNLRIAEYHTYFVGSDGWGFDVWAHNAEYVAPGGLTPAERQEAIEALKEEIAKVQSGSGVRLGIYTLAWGWRVWEVAVVCPFPCPGYVLS